MSKISSWPLCVISLEETYWLLTYFELLFNIEQRIVNTNMMSDMKWFYHKCVMKFHWWIWKNIWIDDLNSFGCILNDKDVQWYVIYEEYFNCLMSLQIKVWLSEHISNFQMHISIVLSSMKTENSKTHQTTCSKTYPFSPYKCIPQTVYIQIIKRSIVYMYRWYLIYNCCLNRKERNALT